MLFWIILALTIGAIVWAIVDDVKRITSGFISSVIAVITAGVCLISVFWVAAEHITADGYTAAYEKLYESLTYQLENDIYENDNDLGKKELMDDIQTWNTDLAKYKKYQNDFWIGIYYADIYDQFEFIELK